MELHFDRIGPDAYNQELLEACAQTENDYLMTHGLAKTPVTKDCPLGSMPEVIHCLQPDRRVTIDVIGEPRGEAGKP